MVGGWFKEGLEVESYLFVFCLYKMVVVYYGGGRVILIYLFFRCYFLYDLLLFLVMWLFCLVVRGVGRSGFLIIVFCLDRKEICWMEVEVG